MINLIRAEIKKLLKSKLFYVILGLILFSAVMTIIEYFIIKSKISNSSTPQKRVQMMKNMIDSGSFYGINAPYQGIASFPIWMIAMSVMASVIAVADFASGTIKNIISVGKRRIDIYFSKLLTMFIVSIVFLVTNILFNTIVFTTAVGWGKEFEWNQLGPIFRMAGVEAVMFLAIAAFAMFLGIIFRNSKLTIGVGFIIPIGIAIFGGFCTLFESLQNLPKYFPGSIMEAVGNSNPTYENIIIALTVGVGIIIVSTIIGIYTFEKRDINISDT